MFQFTHPRGVRQTARRAHCNYLKFQFTHPRGVRRNCKNTMAYTQIGFNSRTREGCDAYLGYIPANSFDVSIHAPARGATASICHNSLLISGFNSRTREGCDNLPLLSVTGFLMFQFTHPRGVRPFLVQTIPFSSSVSIHAPARGATKNAEKLLKGIDLFQFTHPRGVRQSINCKSIRRARFNSRTREGCDSIRFYLSIFTVLQCFFCEILYCFMLLRLLRLFLFANY